MRLPAYTPTVHRRMRLVLLPLRLAGCAFCLLTVWRLLRIVEQPAAPTGSAAGDIALGTLTGLLIGIHIAICVVGAVSVWYPLPKPERKR